MRGNFQTGQALVTLLVFAGMALAVTAGAIAVAVINIQSTSQFAQGQQAFYSAEAGAEDAIMHLVRDQSFSSSGYTIQVGTSSVTVTVQPPGIVTSKTIVSRGIVNNYFKRRVQVVGSFDSNGIFSVTTWDEIND